MDKCSSKEGYRYIQEVKKVCLIERRVLQASIEIHLSAAEQ